MTIELLIMGVAIAAVIGFAWKASRKDPLPTQTALPPTPTPSPTIAPNSVLWNTSPIHIFDSGDVGFKLEPDGTTHIFDDSGWKQVNEHTWLYLGNGSDFEMKWVITDGPVDGFFITPGTENTWLSMVVARSLILNGNNNGINSGEVMVTIRKIADQSTAVTKLITLESETII